MLQPTQGSTARAQAGGVWRGGLRLWQKALSLMQKACAQRHEAEGGPRLWHKASS